MTVDDGSALTGEVVFATPQNNASLSRQATANRALRLARGVYVTGTALPPEAVGYFHRFTIIEHFWPGAVLCGVTALNAGEVVSGYMFVAHPYPERTGKLELPGFTVQPQVAPGPLPGDVELVNGLWMSGVARRLVENVNLRGRPTRVKPAPTPSGVRSSGSPTQAPLRCGQYSRNWI